jgi:phosphoglycerate dehydrogenase-like enzyme
MKTSELEKLGFECLQDQFEDVEIAGGYTSDLLSDVMANLTEHQVLITIQAHKNTVAVASLADAAAIVFCHGRKVAPDIAAAAAQEGIALFSSPENQFDTTCQVAEFLRAKVG